MRLRAEWFRVLSIAFLVSAFSSPSAAAERGLSLASPGSLPDKALGAYHALIVGINDYEKWNPLQTAVKDATALRDVLVAQYGFRPENVLLRTDQEATLTRLVDDLRSLASGLTDRDNFLVYFAGHGQLDDLTGDGYWIPVDGRLKDPVSWLSHSLLKGVLGSEKVALKNVVVIADSCYSGALLRGGPSLLKMEDRAYLDKLVEAASRRSRQVITSGGIEPVADGGRDGHSLFAYYLITALQENDHEVVDLENLFHTRVWEPVTQIGGQRPNVGRLKTPMDEDGQFVLVNRGLAERKAALAAEEARVQERHEARVRGEVEEQKRIEEERARLEDDRRRLEEERRLLEDRKKLEAERLAIEKEKQRLALEAERQKLEYDRARADSSSVRPAAESPRVASLPPTPSVPPPAGTKRTMAVLPGEFRNVAPFYQYEGSITETTSISVIANAVMENPDFRLTHSMDPGIDLQDKGVQEITLSPEEARDLWTQSGLFSRPEPASEIAAAIGRRLGVDLVFMVQASGSPSDPVTLKTYLVDTATGRIVTASGKIASRTFRSELDQRVRRQLTGYLKESVP